MFVIRFFFDTASGLMLRTLSYLSRSATHILFDFLTLNGVSGIFPHFGSGSFMLVKGIPVCRPTVY